MIHRGRTLVLGIGAALCLAGMALLLATPVRAADCSFPATGQTTAYTADKNGHPDAVVPDDGTVRAGDKLHYTDNGNGTVTDKVTGLIWEKKGNNGGLHDVTKTLPWSSTDTDTIWDWLDDVNAEGGHGFARHRDWRIPNVKELQSIINYEKNNPAVASAFHTNCIEGSTVFTGSCTAASGYWSSSTVASRSDLAWNVDFNLGDVQIVNKTFPSSVRAVRGGCALGPN